MSELPKAYEPGEHEDAIAQMERDSGLYNPDNLPGERKEVFSMVLPPPNATGTLHIGHAVMLAIQDIMIRFARMRGKKALWVPGTDHAAIATQVKVEKILHADEGKTRHDLGREKFLERVDDYVEKSRSTINHQVREMGCSIDWTREAFTLDDKRNKAVRTMFKNMYDEGLIYRGDRIVNWDPKLKTTVSDDEVDRKKETAPFYYMQYGPFVIGTSRPETKFGDKYVVMHPEDDRYKEYKDGQSIDLEWVNGPITATVIKDDVVDMGFGTGVMTITPWHDATDFEIAERHGLDKEQVIDFDGNLMSVAGEFEGLPIEEGRKKIVEKLDSKGLMVKIDEDYVHNLAVNSRGGGTIEPQIMRQWFVGVEKEFAFKQSKRNPIEGLKDGETVTLKKLMQHVVETGQVQIIPGSFDKTYNWWVDNLRDWNISRQLWYGHRIPAWHKGEEVFVGIDAPEGEGWEQDEDVLDTWFSSGMWTFSTLGWPNEDAPDLETYHPTTMLETGRDIIFFWVARMILMSTYALGEVPFRYTYLHGMVRDEEGRKMSKSLDNIIDPLDMIEKFGTDATRLSLVVGLTPGMDTRLSETKIAGFRNFTNKLWNIGRFVLMSVSEAKVDVVSEAPKATSDADHWILSRLNSLIESVTEKLDEPNFAISQAGDELRDFTWNDFADWYVEIAKDQLKDDDLKEGTEEILLHVLQSVLKLWHPFMPFVTQKLWSEIADTMLLIEDWPEVGGKVDKKAASRFDYQVELAREVRRLKRAYTGASSIKAWDLKFDMTTAANASLSRLTQMGIVVEEPTGEDHGVRGEAAGQKVMALLEDADMEDARTRLEEEIRNVEGYIGRIDKKLKNKKFVQGAPPEVVEGEKGRLGEAKERLVALQEQLESIQ